MRRLLSLLLLAGCAVAQKPADVPQGTSAHLPPVPTVSSNVTEPLVQASHADVYCAGFLAKAPARKDTYVLGGLLTPNETRFHAGDFMFINGDYAPNSRVSFVRQTQDVDRLQAFPTQTAALKKVGDVFADLGYGVVVEKRGETTVVKVEYSCDAVVPGDWVVPFVPRPEVSFRKHTTVDRFPENAKSMGRIVAARDFDQYVASGQKVYFDIGAQKGLKPGDLFLVVRSYRRSEMDAVDEYEEKTGAFEDTRKNEPKLPRDLNSKLPEHVIGEAVVLSTNDNTATAMITFAVSEVHVGDRIASESEKGTGSVATYEKEHSMKMPRLGSLCVFAVLNCPRTRPTPAADQTATGGSGAPAAAAR